MKRRAILAIALFFGVINAYSQKADVQVKIDTSEFSPNGDGINDSFVFNAVNMISVNVKIVDKTNNLVYKSEKLGDKWDGNDLKGQKAPVAVYFYTFKATGADGKKYIKNGAVKLTR